MTTATPTVARSIPAKASQRTEHITVLLAVSLLLTGASGLIYQVVWFRVLGLVFGACAVRGIKCALSLLDICDEQMAATFRPATAEQRAATVTALKELKLL